MRRKPGTPEQKQVSLVATPSSLKPRMLSFDAPGEEDLLRDNLAAISLNDADAIALREERPVQLHVDDSSDEEEVEHARSVYNIDAAWEGYAKERYSAVAASDTAYIKLPFIVHALGAELLYGQKEVNTRYYAQKRRHLGASPIAERTQRGIQFFTFIQEKTQQDLIVFLKHYYPVTEELAATLKEAVAETCAAWKERLLHMGQSRKWLQQVRHSLAHVTREPSQLQLHIDRTILDNFAHEVFISAHRHIEANGFLLPANAPNFIPSPELQAHITQHALERARENQQYGWLGVDGRTPKKGAIRDWRYLPSQFDTTLRKLLNEAGHPAEASQKIAQIVNNDLFNAYAGDLLQQDRAAFGSPDSPAWKTAKQFPELKAVIGYSPARLHAEWYNLFSAAVLQHAYGSFPLNRQTLPDMHRFENNDGADLLANMRLHKRSETRAMHNYADNFAYKAVINQQNSGSIYLRKILQLWKFAEGGDNLVEHGIQSSLGQSEYMPTLGQYPAIYKDIAAKKQSYFFTDEQLAGWMRNVLNGTASNAEPALLPWIANLTNLIIAVEGTRNPAALVTHHMMLDLIENKRLSWQQALELRQMPMAPVGATAEARSVHNDFDGYMPHHYQYRGTKGKTANLMQSEETITHLWLNMKLHPNTPYPPQAWRVWTAKENASAIAGIIRKEFPVWFAAKNVAQGQVAAHGVGR
jgi:hypothetical protein